MKRYLSDRQLDYVIRKMFRAVGAEYKGIASVTQANWFMDHSWTEEEEKAFEVWLISYVKTRTRASREEAMAQAGNFMFQYGWCHQKPWGKEDYHVEQRRYLSVKPRKGRNSRDRSHK